MYETYYLLQENPDSFISMLKSTGKTHTKFTGFKPEYFQVYRLNLSLTKPVSLILIGSLKALF